MAQSLYEQLVIQTQMNYSQYYGVYANGGTPVKLTDKKPLPYEQQIETFADRVKLADHVSVGGASGLSTAGGGDFYYAATPSYKKAFRRFYDRYHFKGGVCRHGLPVEQSRGVLGLFSYLPAHDPARARSRTVQGPAGNPAR